MILPQNLAIYSTRFEAEMKGKSPDPKQLSFYNQRLADQLNPKHPLYRLAESIPWDYFEKVYKDRRKDAGLKRYVHRFSEADVVAVRLQPQHKPMSQGEKNSILAPGIARLMHRQ